MCLDFALDLDFALNLLPDPLESTELLEVLVCGTGAPSDMSDVHCFDCPGTIRPSLEFWISAVADVLLLTLPKSIDVMKLP